MVNAALSTYLPLERGKLKIIAGLAQMQSIYTEPVDYLPKIVGKKVMTTLTMQGLSIQYAVTCGGGDKHNGQEFGYLPQGRK